MLVCMRESNVVSYLVEALQSSQHLVNLFNNFASSYLYIYIYIYFFFFFFFFFTHTLQSSREPGYEAIFSLEMLHSLI